MADKGLLIVVSGFSGAGKGTLMKELLNNYPSDYALSISATTRGPRVGEENGREYFFKTVDEFKEMIDNDMLVEYAQYVGNYYGTPRAYVEEQLDMGKSVILEIEIQGALNIKSKFPEAVLMFITAPSAEVLRNRLIGRGTESIEVVEARLARAIEEAQGVENYDYVVINDVLEDACQEIHKIICSEKERSGIRTDRLNLVDTIKTDLEKYSKGDK